MQARAAEQKRLLANYKGRPSVTKSGRKVNVYANIGSVSDVAYVQENDAEGIGLFRSEFLYLGKTALPDETEQFNTYRQVLQTMGGKKVIIERSTSVRIRTSITSDSERKITRRWGIARSVSV